jgi:PHP family Zn ribbon phosphoesterase
MTIGVGKMNVQTLENIVRDLTTEIEFLLDVENEEIENVIREVLHDNINPEEVI